MRSPAARSEERYVLRSPRPSNDRGEPAGHPVQLLHLLVPLAQGTPALVACFAPKRCPRPRRHPLLEVLFPPARYFPILHNSGGVPGRQERRFESETTVTFSYSQHRWPRSFCRRIFFTACGAEDSRRPPAGGGLDSSKESSHSSSPVRSVLSFKDSQPPRSDYV